MATHALPLRSPAERVPQTLIPRIENDPRVIAFAQTTAGKMAMLATATGLFYIRGVRDPVVIAVLAGIFFLPQHTWTLMGISGIYWMPSMVKGGFSLNQRIIGVALAIGVAMLLRSMIRKWPRGLVGRNPRLTLLAVFAGAVGAALVATHSDLTWSFVAALSASLWIFSFALTERAGTSNGPRLWSNAAMFFSFFPTSAASTVPFFKRPSAMRRMEAKSPEERAIVQLKGLKLLAWSILLALVWAILDTASEAMGIPKLPDAIAASTAHHPPAWYLCWGSLFAGFLDSVLRTAIWGDTVVAGCRLAGFKLLRNSYRPLESRTMVDFWNRYYYYFKELIADFFFYPVYMRCFKKHARIRMLFATWVSVGLGVPLFHFVRDIDAVRELGLWRAVAGYHVYLCYATMLSIGIGVSQIRKMNTAKMGRQGDGRQETVLWTRVLPIASVVLFFCFLQVFDELRRTVPIREHVLFLTRLAGWTG